MSLQLKINFYGLDIPLIKKDGYYWTPIKPICDDIGINYLSQIRLIKADSAISWVHLKVQSGLQKRRFFCIRKDFLGGWLFSITISRVSNESAKEKLFIYKSELYQVIDNYLTKGIAVNLNPTLEQSEELKKELEQNPELAEFIEEQASYIQQLKKEISDMKTAVEYGALSPNTGLPCIHAHRFSYYPAPRTKEQIEADRQKKLYGNQPLLPFNEFNAGER